jgi:cytochrome P450
MRAAVKTISDFAYDIIDKRAKDVELETKGEKEAGADDLLTLYMALRDEKGQPMSRTALRDAVVNLIIAGVRPLPPSPSWARR